jgi:hypothetical protein
MLWREEMVCGQDVEGIDKIEEKIGTRRRKAGVDIYRRERSARVR